MRLHVRVLAITLLVASAPSTASAVRCGDLNNNGTVSNGDRTLLDQVIAGTTNPAPLCGGQGALSCGDLAPINAPNGVLSNPDSKALRQSLNGVAGVPPPHYLVCDPGSCESDMDEGPSWNAHFGSTLTPVPWPFEPNLHPAVCTPDGSTLLTTGNAGTPAVVTGDQGYAGSPRVADATFLVPAADYSNWGHIFVGTGESDPTGGRIGVAVGDMGYAAPTSMYIEFVVDSSSTPGCTVPADGLQEGPHFDADDPDVPGPSDDTWVFYPGNGGIALPTLVAGRWYRVASIAGLRNDGGISVTVSWHDLTTLELRSTAYDFPAECTPTWWDTADQRPWFGFAPKAAAPAGVDMLIGDLFLRPARF